MLDLGTRLPGSTIYIPVNTFDSNDPSASVTATNWATTDCHVHKDGGTTQRASSAGETLSIDFDTITGNHLLQIDLSDDTTAGFYQAGSTYTVRIEGVTVDAATINAWIAQWRIGYPGALLDTTIATLSTQASFTLSAGSADNDAYNNWVAVIHDKASATQIAVGLVADYTGASKTITLNADPGIFTMAAGDNISLFPPANTTTTVNNIATTIGTAGAGLTDLGGMSTTMKGQVNAEADTAISDAALATAAALATVDGIVDNLVSGIIFGAAATGTLSTTQATTDLTGYADDQLIGRLIIWLDGACAGEESDITDYANSSGLITFTALTTAPANGDNFKIV